MCDSFQEDASFMSVTICKRSQLGNNSQPQQSFFVKTKQGLDWDSGTCSQKARGCTSHEFTVTVYFDISSKGSTRRPTTDISSRSPSKRSAIDMLPDLYSLDCGCTGLPV